MSVRRFLLAFVAGIGLTAAAVVSRESEPLAAQMAGVANKLVGSLDDDQKSKAAL